MPDSWIVVYNLDDPFSVIWANSYQSLRHIPASNMFGVHASTTEHLATKDEAQAQIITPVRNFLTNNPQIEARTMGILVGYGVPGTYATPPAGGPGGFSMADALEDMWDDDLTPAEQKEFNNVDNPQFLNPAQTLPPNGRLTKATMDPGRYMTARIDAPSLSAALNLVVRSLQFEAAPPRLEGQFVYYDYIDAQALPQGEWVWLRKAIEEVDLMGTPWREFDSDTEFVINAAFSFGTHALTGWNDNRLYLGTPPGARILAYNYNSYGATTVRSTTAQGGRFVPNALEAGYLAAIGATGEPFCCLGPIPETMLAGLREGWTIGESFHIASVYDDWMWTLFADPLMTVPVWFPPPEPIAGNGDGNGDGVVNGLDIACFAQVITDPTAPQAMRESFDISGDGEIDDDDLFLFFGPTLHNTYNVNALRGTAELDGNGVVDAEDLRIFVEMLHRGEADKSLRARLTADMNKNGRVDLGDVESFVEMLLYGRVIPGRSCSLQPPMPPKPGDIPSRP